MPTIEGLFRLHNARSRGFEVHQPGTVAFVTNTLRDNGVLGFVKPMAQERVFDFVGIVLSTFCEATVQIPPFMPRGNGGSGLMVLEPRSALSPAELASIAAYINARLRWRFSWYRQATLDRVRRLHIPAPSSSVVPFRVAELLPRVCDMPERKFPRKWKLFRLDSIYAMEPGAYHEAAKLPSGRIPLVSCGETDNGILRFVQVPQERLYHHKLTIAFNGNTLTAKYHPYMFAAKDDVAVCSPLSPLHISTELLIQIMLNRERWRYSYYRKCFMDKLRRFAVLLPARDGRIDEDDISIAMGASPYWEHVRSHLESKPGRVRCANRLL